MLVTKIIRFMTKITLLKTKIEVFISNMKVTNIKMFRNTIQAIILILKM